VRACAHSYETPELKHSIKYNTRQVRQYPECCRSRVDHRSWSGHGGRKSDPRDWRGDRGASFVGRPCPGGKPHPHNPRMSGYSTAGRIRMILTIQFGSHVSSGPFQSIAMTVGNYGGSVCNIIPNAGNDGAGVHDIVVNAGSGKICVYYKCFLGAANQQRSSLKRQNAR